MLNEDFIAALRDQRGRVCRAPAPCKCHPMAPTDIVWAVDRKESQPLGRRLRSLHEGLIQLRGFVIEFVEVGIWRWRRDLDVLPVV